MLANIYLHEVLDLWFERDVKPRLDGRASIIRYADDFVIVLDKRSDVQKLMTVLPKRFEKYGLKLHPDKTRVVAFARPPLERKGDDDDGPGSFDFLGFTHFWGRSREGRWVVKRKTSKRRFTRSLKKIWQWCKANRHEDVAQQQKQLNLKRRHVHASRTRARAE